MSDDFAATPQWALIFAIHSGGPKAMARVLQRGLKAEHLGDDQDPAVKVFKLFERFYERGTLPSIPEIKMRAGIPLEGAKVTAYDLEEAVEYMAEAVMFKEMREGVSKALKEMRKDVRAGHKLLNDVASHSGRWLRKSEMRGTSDASWIGDMYARYMKAANREPGVLLGLPFPWDSLNEVSQGLQKGEMTVVLAKRKTGKTWTTFTICDHILRTAAQPGDKILYVSPEMPEPLVMSRYTAVNLKLDYARFRRGRLDNHERQRLEEYVAAKRAPDVPKINWLYGKDLPEKNVRDIVNVVEQTEPILVVVDSLYVLGDRRRKIYERTLETIELLALDLATDCDIPVLCTSQLSGKTDKKDTNADADAAAYAKALGDYADGVLGLFKPPESDNTRILRGMEAREYEPIDLRINFDMVRMDFSEIEVIVDEEEGDSTVQSGGDAAAESGFVQEQAIEF